MFRLGVVLSAILATTASAQPGFVEQPPTGPETQPKAPPPPPDVDHAPLPGQESGRTDAVDDGDTTGLEVERAAVTPVRWLAELAFAPIHGAITLWGRHRLSHQVGGLDSDGGMSVKLQPLLRVESGYGIAGFTGGAHLEIHNVLDEHEQIAATAAGGAGGYIRQFYELSLRSGRRFGDAFELGLSGSYEDRPRDGFYGVGNAPMAVIRFGQQRAATTLAGDVRIADELHLVPSATLARDDYTLDVEHHASAADAQLELRWDNEHPAGAWAPQYLPTTGTYAAFAIARSQRLDDTPDFWRARLDVEQLVRLGIGPRFLSFRLHTEELSTANVPLPELPALGGPLYLRGYALDEFRDRAAAVATIEYRWDLAEWLGAHLFVDGGRVAPSLDAMRLDGLHVGYGGGIVFGRHGAVIDVASTLDGGFLFAASIGALPATGAGR